MLGHIQEEQQQDDDRTSERQVDPETPSPGNFAREGAPNHGPENSRYHEDAHPSTNQHRMLLGLGHVLDDEGRAAENTGDSQALKGSTDDHGSAIRSCCGL